MKKLKKLLKGIFFSFVLYGKYLIPAITLLIAIITLTWPILSKSRNYWIAVVIYCVFFIFIVYIYSFVHKGARLPYSDFWISMRGARKWIRMKLKKNSSAVNRSFGEVIVMGIATTDIVYLFNYVVSNLMSGVRFKVIMVNPEFLGDEDVEDIGNWESGDIVRDKVQEPLIEELERLSKHYKKENPRLKDKLNELRSNLLDSNLTSHTACIDVCARLWKLAEDEAKKRKNIDSGRVLIDIKYINEFPQLRLWIFGELAFVCSVYIGFRGVGVDSPVFCYSVDSDERNITVVKRALHYVNQLL